MNKISLQEISTEKRNENTMNIDKVDSITAVNMIIEEDKLIHNAMQRASEDIANALDAINHVIENGGNVYYIGAGTSGRLGILDASEILPTYGEGNIFKGLIAGGSKAVVTPVENAEDDEEQAVQDLKDEKFSKQDVLVGISASGRTPYVYSAITFANKIGAKTISLATSREAKISSISDVAIEVVTGAEVITGSTRMKSGTAQKMVLNILSSLAMVNKGKVYENLMIDLKPTNKKLVQRAVNIIVSVTGSKEEEAVVALREADDNVKVAIISLIKKISIKDAKKLSDKKISDL